ncbi:MAG: type II toxin-antitoxin system VapC family toxin [Actinobacteria bacterium]|nr:type II toxin-antitoxin system VapC family toxin [Actinomycetota bacterium]
MNNDYFLETSAFTKRYTKEPGHQFIDKIFSANHQLFYLSVTYCEIIKIFYRLYKYPQINDTKISENKFNKLNAALSNDLLLASRISITDEIVSKSKEILNVGWLKSSIDILILSGFIVTKDIYRNLYFITADNDLSDLAKKFSNDVINLNQI